MTTGGQAAFWAKGVLPVDADGKELTHIERKELRRRRLDENTEEVVMGYGDGVKTTWGTSLADLEVSFNAFTLLTMELLFAETSLFMVSTFSRGNASNSLFLATATTGTAPNHLLPLRQPPDADVQE